MTVTTESICTPLTWADLIAGEPRLAELRAEAEAVSNDDPDFCHDRVFLYDRPGYRSLKKRIKELLNPYEGPHAGTRLSTSSALALALDTVYLALPHCRYRECPPCCQQPKVCGHA